MHEPHKALIQKFYNAFANHDAETMASCYHDSIEFRDPGFGLLKGQEAGDMWRMLVERGGKNLVIIYSDVQANETEGKAYWEAVYNFSKTGRKVHNKIHASFTFKDGLIAKHDDHFDFWTWSRMALGLPGVLLGWSSFLKNKVQNQARGLLKKFRQKRAS
ncbi:MAG: nuclear transport factor 2 family protein [Bacteroidota bacterium]